MVIVGLNSNVHQTVFVCCGVWGGFCLFKGLFCFLRWFSPRKAAQALWAHFGDDCLCSGQKSILVWFLNKKNFGELSWKALQVQPLKFQVSNTSKPCWIAGWGAVGLHSPLAVHWGDLNHSSHSYKSLNCYRVQGMLGALRALLVVLVLQGWPDWTCPLTPAWRTLQHKHVRSPAGAEPSRNSPGKPHSAQDLCTNPSDRGRMR